MKRTLLPILLLLCLCTVAQQPTFEVGKYPFIKYKSNHLHYDTASENMTYFFSKWEDMVLTKQGRINIVHIGGSHVQAGTLSNTIRFNICNTYPDLIAGRGLIFPYSAAARCNNPSDYKVHCPQKVVLTRNVQASPQYRLGVSGIAITAHDEPTEITILMNDVRIDYNTNKVVVLGYSNSNVVPKLRFDNREIYPSYIDTNRHRYVYHLANEIDSFAIFLPCKAKQEFTLTGVLLDNDSAGFTFHSLGVNGAAVPDYHKCTNFVKDMRLLRPDMVIFGIGINDANTKNFDTAAFRTNYQQLIDSILSINPHCAFVFITNNDSYKKTGKRTYKVNTNGRLARDVFYRLAKNNGGAVWDQFEIMGGLRSMETWNTNRLAQRDRVHFTQSGYTLLGNLFSTALFEAFYNYEKTGNKQK